MVFLFSISIIAKDNFHATSGMNDDRVWVASNDVKTFSIYFRNKSTSKTTECWHVDRSALEWYIATFLQILHMDDTIPYALQFDAAMMPSIIIKTEGDQFAIRTMTEHVIRMLEMLEKHGLPTSTSIPPLKN